MSDQPVVSILMPVYNGEKFLAEALDSLASQTLKAYELIAINDGSHDRSAEILETHQRRDGRIRVIHQQHSGLVESLNRGLALARGRYLARMDADDLSMPDRLERQVHFLERSPEYIMVGSAYELVDEQGAAIRIDRLPVTDTQIRWHLLFHSPFAHPSVLFRLDRFQEHDLAYDPQALHAEDFELWSRLLSHGRGQNFAIPLIKRRVHPGQIGQTVGMQQQETANGVAQANMAKLGLRTDLQDMATLRRWYHRFPKTLSDADLPACMFLLQAVTAFSRLPDLDRSQVRQIRGRWVGKVLSALPLDKWRAAKRLGIFQFLHPQDIRNILVYTLSRG